MFKFDRNIAFIIGINEYQNGIPHLKTARYDAEYLADILKSNYDYEVERLLDQDATSDNIWARFELVRQRIKPNERVQLLFYFAGHGTPPSDEAGETGYLVPQGGHSGELASFLSMQKIHKTLVGLKCHHLLVILDCCFAGAFRFTTRDIGVIHEELSKERYDRYTQYGAAQVIASAAHDQKAIDIVLNNRGTSKDREFANHSPFAAALLRALKYEAADYTKDGITTATELFLYVSEEVLAQTQNLRNPQVPRLWPLQNHDKGEYIFLTGDFNYDRLPSAPELNEQNNPYRGLAAFDEAHSKYFFGREVLIKELFNRITKDERSQNRENSPYPTLTVVLGVSGSGKSSLVKAGLIPYLRQHDAKGWQILDPVRLGNTPFDSLAKTMLNSQEESLTDKIAVLDELYKALRKARKKSPHDKDLGQLISEWSQVTPEGRLLLVIRYFDQIQTFCHQFMSLDQLEQLRQIGLSRSKLVLENIESLQKECRPEERSVLEHFHQQCLKKIKTWSYNWQVNPSEFSQFIIEWCQSYPQTKLLLIVDQFEELITLCHPEERNPFLELLKAGLEACPQQLRIVLTLRADFEPRFIESEQLQSYWKDARFPMRAMRSHELRQAIEKPAMEQVLYFEPADLVDRLIDEVGQMPGTLPLLSFTLSELYRESLRQDRKDRALRGEDYNNKLGGVAGSLTRRATEEYNKLDDDRKITMRHIMLRMLALEGGEVARRRVLRSELVYSDPKTGERLKKNAQVEEIIRSLVDARLLTRGEQEGKDYEGRDYIEPAHDLLVRGWELIQEWIEKYKEDIMLQQRLIDAATDWQRRDRPTSLLITDTHRLHQVKQILDSDDSWFNRDETEFALKSLDLEAAKYLVAQSEFVRNTPNTPTTLSTLLALESLLRYRTREGELALRQSLALSPHKRVFLPNLSDRVKTALHPNGDQFAYADEHDDRIITIHDIGTETEVSTLIHESPVSWLNYSYQGHYLVSIIQPHHAKIQRVANNEEICCISHEAEFDFAFSEDNNYLVTLNNYPSKIGDSECLRVINIISGEVVAYARWENNHFQFITYFDQELLNSLVGYIVQIGKRVFNLRTGQRLSASQLQWQTHSSIQSILSPNNKYLATIDNKALSVWDRISGQKVEEFNCQSYWDTEQTKFSSDSRYLVMTDRNGASRIWNCIFNQTTILNDGSSIGTIKAISPGGKLISLQNKQSIILWDLQSAQEFSRFSNDSEIKRIVLSLDEHYLCLDCDLVVHVLEIVQTNEGISLRKIASIESVREIRHIIFSSDSRYLALVGSENIRLWNVSLNQEIALLTPIDIPYYISFCAFSPDGFHLASGVLESWTNISTGKTIQIWQTSSGENVAALVHDCDYVTDAKFNLDGNLILTRGNDSIIRIWEVSSGRRVTQIAHQDAILEAEFSADGNFIKTKHNSNAQIRYLWKIQDGSFVGLSLDTPYWVSSEPYTMIHVWDAQNYKLLRRFGYYSSSITMALSQDERYVAGVTQTGVSVWSLDDSRLVSEYEITGEIALDDLQFSSNSEYLVGRNGSDKSVSIFPLNQEQSITQFRVAKDFNPETSTNSAWIEKCLVNRDGSYIFTSRDDQVMQVWQVSNGAVSLKFSLEDVYAIQLSSDGRCLAVVRTIPADSQSSRDREVRVQLLNAITLQEIRTVTPESDFERFVIFNLDNSCALAIGEPTSYIWEIASGRKIPAIGDCGFGGVVDPTHQYFGSYKYENGVKILALYRWWPDDIVADAQTRPERNFTLQEWQTFFKDEPYRKTYPILPPGSLTLGQAMVREGQLDEAIALFQEAQALDPDLNLDIEQEVIKARIPILVEQSRELAQAGNIQDSIVNLEEIHQLVPDFNIEQLIVEMGELAVPALLQQARDLASAYEPNVEESIAKFKQAQEYATATIDIDEEVARLAVPKLLEWGKRLCSSYTLDREGAISKFKQALQLDPTLAIDPEQEATGLIVVALVEAGERLAQEYEPKLEEAIKKFQQALELAPELNFNPKEKAGKLVAPKFVEQGKNLARDGRFVEASAKFQAALELDSSLELDPQAEIANHIVPKQLEQGKALAQVGNVKAAVELYKIAEAIAPAQVSAGAFNSLCWFGCLHGYPGEVMFACDKAVELEPENLSFIDSRGLARALIGNFQGSIEDFQFYVARITDEARKVQRQQWIDALQRGENPFTPQELESLLGQ